MRLGLAARTLPIAIVVCLALVPAARAVEPAATNPAADTRAARAHFKNGVKLYEDGNFTGALAEFEAAYELKPGPGSLQNVALCQKALFRYGEAADTLTRLLARHGSELSASERSAAERARDELETLVGSVRLALSPPNADVTLDERPLSTNDRASALRLNVGEHTVTVSAPGYTSATERFQVASGPKDVTVSIALAPVPAVATSETSAPVVVPHPAPSGSAAPPAAERATPKAKPAAGWYAEGSASLLATNSTPFRFDLSKAKSSAWGLGIRGGYRLRPAAAVAGLVEFDVLRVRHACDEYAGEIAPTPVLCGDADQIVANYLVRSLRFGPTVEFMTTDPRLRAIGAIGLGAVWHQIRLGVRENGGVDPYLLLEIGVGANSKHVLFALTAETVIDGTRGMIEDRALGPGGSVHEAAFARSNHALAFVGLNLRAGVSAWSP